MVLLDHDLVNDFLRVILMEYGVSWQQKLSPDDLMACKIRLLQVSGWVDIVVVVYNYRWFMGLAGLHKNA